MKRTPLKRKTPLRAKKRSTSKPKRKSKHARRPRSFPYMGWVKTQPCFLVTIGATEATPCNGPIEADHAGSKTLEGDGLRAYDSTCIPLCSQHHRERHDFSGSFASYDQSAMRVFLTMAIATTRLYAKDQGIDVPDDAAVASENEHVKAIIRAELPRAWVVKDKKR